MKDTFNMDNKELQAAINALLNALTDSTPHYTVYREQLKQLFAIQVERAKKND